MLFPAELFAELFPSKLGRPSLPPEMIASVIVLQTLHGLSDREAAEAVTFDLRWKAACGLAIDATSFHPTVLTYWRQRLARSARPHLIFEVIRELIATTGAVAGKQRRALDSTVVDDAVARQDTVTQLIAAIRRVGRDVPGAQALIERVCIGHDYTDPGKPAIAWDDQDAREELVARLVNDALALLGAVAEDLDLDAIETAGGKPAEALALLALVAGQDVEPAEGSDGSDGRWRIARNVAKDRTISTVDPEARHAHKTREDRRDGYTAHIVAEPDTGLYTGVELTKASGAENSDATVGTRLLADDPTLDLEEDQRKEALADSAYGTGQALADLTEDGWVPIIKPWPLKPAVPGGFTVDDFTHDPDGADGQGTLTCPAGHTRPLSPKRNVTFGAICRGCPLMEQCTASKSGKSTTVHEHDLIHREHRQRAKDPDFQAVYRQHRPMVERSIAWLVRGNRRVPYRGVAKNNAWLHHRAAALNLRRLLAMGLSTHQGTWKIA